jgi:hypothetical protein
MKGSSLFGMKYTMFAQPLQVLFISPLISKEMFQVEIRNKARDFVPLFQRLALWPHQRRCCSGHLLLLGVYSTLFMRHFFY